MKNDECFKSNHNCFKCAFLHTLTVKMEGGLTFFTVNVCRKAHLKQL